MLTRRDWLKLSARAAAAGLVIPEIVLGRSMVTVPGMTRSTVYFVDPTPYALQIHEELIPDGLSFAQAFQSIDEALDRIDAMEEATIYVRGEHTVSSKFIHSKKFVAKGDDETFLTFRNCEFSGDWGIDTSKER